MCANDVAEKNAAIPSECPVSSVKESLASAHPCLQLQPTSIEKEIFPKMAAEHQLYAQDLPGARLVPACCLYGGGRGAES